MANKAEVVATVQETLSKFHCDICNKGYANVAQWEEHLLSYGHNHAKRKKEVAMQSRSIRNNADEINKRREKEKKREQKELERILKATGGSLPTAASTSSASSSGSIPLSAAGAAPAAPPAEKKKGGFFKIANSSTPVPPPPISQPALPPPPPPPDSTYAPPPPPPSFGAVQPPPPPPPVTNAPLSSSAPKFTSSKDSNLKSTWTSWKPPVPTIAPTIPSNAAQAVQPNNAPGQASTWRPTAAPGLHPLLASEISSSPSTGQRSVQSGNPTGNRWQGAARDQRNDFFRKEGERSHSPYELPTAASTINTTRAPKGMSFVSATTSRPSPMAQGGQASGAAKPAGISLAGNAPVRKKALDMNDDEDEEDEGSGMPLPTGRPKARMPVGGGARGKIGFGNMGR